MIGCVAYHRLRKGCCEMKRLYVKPEFQGKQVRRQLVEEILRLAREDGFQEMVLDTLRPMTAAISLYINSWGSWRWKPITTILCRM